jgi:TRAP-type C4-dicarboxylate transport system permease small subunit
LHHEATKNTKKEQWREKGAVYMASPASGCLLFMAFVASWFRTAKKGCPAMPGENADLSRRGGLPGR